MSSVLGVFTWADPEGEPRVAGGYFPERPDDKRSNNMGITNYAGCAGRYGVVGESAVDVHRGAFTNRSSTRFSDIKDGTSKTLLFGEAIGRFEKRIRTRPYSWMGVGALPNADALGHSLLDDSWEQNGFDSRHAGVVLFCYADGSVHPLSKDIDTATLVSLGVSTTTGSC